jgi:hypothetical protein
MTRRCARLQMTVRIAGWIAMLAVLGTSRSATAATNIVNANICDTEWTQVEALPRFADRLSRWQALAPKCAKSGLYEARLATLQTLLGRPGKRCAPGLHWIHLTIKSCSRRWPQLR